MTATLQKDFYGFIVDDTGKVIGAVNRFGVPTPIGSIPDSVFSSLADTWMANGGHAQQHATLGVGQNQAQYLLWRLKNQIGHCSILVCSDSTGNETGEWVYIMAQQLAAQYPAFSVRYRLWNDTSLDYDAAVQVSTGTGTFNLDIFNFAVAGTRPDLMLAKRYKKACRDIVDTSVYTTSSNEVQLYIVNHGHNLTGISTENAVILQYQRNIETVLIDHPWSGVIVVGQNPTQNTTDNDQRYQATRKLCARKGWAFADVGRYFYDRNKDASLYVDTVHPTQGYGTADAPTGTRFFVLGVMSNLNFNAAGNGFARNRSVLLGQQYNLLANGSFNTYTGPTSAPDGWTAVNCTVAKDSSLYDSPKGYSTKITGSGSGQPYIYIDLTSAQLAAAKGRWLTFAVRKYIPAGVSSGTVGRSSIVSSSNTGNTSIPYSNIDGGWIWEFVSLFVKTTDSYVRISLYADTANNSTAIANFDRAILIYGDEPGDAL